MTRSAANRWRDCPRVRIAGLIAFLALAVGPSVSRGAGPLVNVLTRHNDIGRSGDNLREVFLTTSNVRPGQFGKLFTRTVDGQIYAQPLYVSNVAFANGTTRNVVIVATMHNTVYAFDADDPAASTPIWQVSLGPSIPVPDPTFGYRYGPFFDIKVEVGALSTPVIDIATQTIYLDAATKEGVGQNPAGVDAGQGPVYLHRLHALDLLTGMEKFGGPVVVAGSVPGTGAGSSGGVVTFDPHQHMQRPALLLSNGLLYIAYGSYADTDPYHGWVFAYDPASLQPMTIYCTTPNAGEGAIWQTGEGLAADGNGHLFMITGNGDFDRDVGGADLGDSFIQLSEGSLSIVDWFTPYNQASLALNDLDLGSAGALLLPGTNYLTGGGKQGKLYVLDRGSMGHFHAGSDSQIVQSFQATNGGIFSSPVYWNGSAGPFLYVWGTSDPIRQYRFNSQSGLFQTTAVAVGPVTSSYPGGSLSVSANGTQAGTGILWALRPSGSTSVLDAYDASNVANQLWNSQQQPGDGLGTFSKFCPPTVANGKVYAATFSKQLGVFGLLAAAPRYASSPVSPNGTIDAGTAAVGSTTNTSLTIDNLGPAKLTVSGPSISGPNAADFSLSGAVFPFDILVGGPSRAVSIGCTPSASGARSATLTMSTNDPTLPTVSYGLACSGIAVGPQGASYYTLPPCRVIDTRRPAGPSGGPALGANATRTFQVAGVCGVPSSATAIAAVLDVVGPSDAGDLRINPAGSSPTSATAINFSALQTRSGNGVFSLGAAGLAVTCDMPAGSTGQTDFVLDVEGYFQ